MKCTQCSCEKLVSTNLSNIFFIDSSLLADVGSVALEANKFLKIYTCTGCGHLEFFDNSLQLKNEEEKEVEKIFEERLSVLVEKQNKIKSYQMELDIIEKQLRDLDITVRQQQELKIQAQKLEEQIKQGQKIQAEIKELAEKKREQLQKIYEKYVLRIEGKNKPEWNRW